MKHERYGKDEQNKLSFDFLAPTVAEKMKKCHINPLGALSYGNVIWAVNLTRISMNDTTDFDQTWHIGILVEYRGHVRKWTHSDLPFQDGGN